MAELSYGIIGIPVLALVGIAFIILMPPSYGLQRTAQATGRLGETFPLLMRRSVLLTGIICPL